MTDNPSTATPIDKPPSTTVLRIVVESDLVDPNGYGHQQMTVWIESGAERPAVAAAMVRLSETGECWVTLGWSPDGPRRVGNETSHEEAVARAIVHAREVANGIEQQRAKHRRRRNEREHARWNALEYDAAPPFMVPD